MPGEYEYGGLMASTWDLFRGDTSGWEDRPLYLGLIRRYGEPALDVGCGTGRLLLDYMAQGLSVDGVDDSPEMLAICRRRARSLGLRPNVHAQKMEALALPRRYRTIEMPFIDRAGLAPPEGVTWVREMQRPDDGATVRRTSTARFGEASGTESFVCILVRSGGRRVPNAQSESQRGRGLASRVLWESQRDEIRPARTDSGGKLADPARPRTRSNRNPAVRAVHAAELVSLVRWQTTLAPASRPSPDQARSAGARTSGRSGAGARARSRRSPPTIGRRWAVPPPLPRPSWCCSRGRTATSATTRARRSSS